MCLLSLGLTFVVACDSSEPQPETESEAEISSVPTPDPDEPMTIEENQPLNDDADGMADRLGTNVAAEYAPVGTLIDPEAPLGQHDANIEIPFGDLPPRGGIHHPMWQACRIYHEPIYPKHAVHSMEHGAVWVTYSPELSVQDKAVLTNTIGVDPFVLLSPYPGLRSPVVLTAWGLQLELDDVEDARLIEFIEVFSNGIQSPEPGASCTGGIQTTIQ